MPQAAHTVDVTGTQQGIWDFLKDYEQWAPLIPGYLAHEAQNDSQFIWVFSADLGLMKKTIKLQVDLAELTEPSKIPFYLKGLSDPFDGNGYFHIAQDGTLTGSLDLSASGIMGRMINSVLESFVPKTVQELTESIRDTLAQSQTIK